MKILRRLGNVHENIVHLIGSKDESELRQNFDHSSPAVPMQSRLLILLEFAANGTLFSWMQDNRTRLSHSLYCRWAKELSSSVAYIHLHRIIHHDIKPHNILLTESLDLKLADFGNALVVENDEELIDGLGRGTQTYSAPELLSPQTAYSFPVDVYSVGVTLYTLLTGDEPFCSARSMSSVQILLAIRQGFFESGMHQVRRKIVFPASGHEDASPFVAIVKHCVALDPEARPTALDLTLDIESAELLTFLHQK